MKLKLTLPEHIGDITLNQYQRYDKLQSRLKDEEITLREFNKLKLNLFAGVPYRSIEDIKQKDLEMLMTQIDKAIGQDCPFVQRFKLNGVEYGFIPNLDEITNAEYFDLNKYGAEVETLHNLMAILFRPIGNVKIRNNRLQRLFKDRKYTEIKNIDKFGNYGIEKYKGTSKYADTMRETPMNIVNGALVFFSILSRELRQHIQRCTAEEQARVQRQQTILQSGVGTVPS